MSRFRGRSGGFSRSRLGLWSRSAIVSVARGRQGLAHGSSWREKGVYLVDRREAQREVTSGRVRHFFQRRDLHATLLSMMAAVKPQVELSSLIS